MHVFKHQCHLSCIEPKTFEFSPAIFEILTLHVRSPVCPLFSNKWIVHHQGCNPLKSISNEHPTRSLSIQPENYSQWRKLFTKNGWSMSARIVFSEMTWSTCFSLIISAFFNIFIAKYSPVFLLRQRRTRPKEPKVNEEILFQTCSKRCWELIIM